MCGRYNFSTEESAELQKIVRQIEAKNSHNKWHMGEIFPTNSAPVLLWEQGHAEPELLGWGFPGFKSGARTIINARAETVAERPMFRQSWSERRCVVPTSGFFEWQKATKRKYLFRLPSGDTTYLAGIWKEFNKERKFCIVTTVANDSISDIHNRMPVVLPKTQIKNWLSSRSTAELLLYAVPPLLIRQSAWL